MSNWALLQEQITGLPVAKRARHGIHFDKGNGEILANFSGKPCHYEDSGIWKPIDTKLVLMPDGSYGCAHSPVRVKPDGNVAVIGSTYAQRIELPSAQTGLIDGDRLVRRFSFGEQVMRITEDGFKSEITLTRIPTLAEAKKLIASESGTLPVTYLKSLTTATDANNNTHTFSTLTAFRTWLASAKFPVVIDPDFGITGGVGADTSINGGAATNNLGINAILYFSAAIKALLRFDLSSVDSGATCTAATLKLTSTASETSDTYALYKIADANGDWIEGTKSAAQAGAGEPCWNAKAADGSGGVTTAWAGSAGLSTAGTDYINTELLSLTTSIADANTLVSMDFNASGLAVIQDWFGDATNNGFVSKLTSGVNRTFHSGESTTEAYRPILTVTYVAAAGGGIIPVSMNARMQVLNGGIHG